MLFCSAEAVLVILPLPFKDIPCMNCMAASNSITLLFSLLKVPLLSAICLLCLVSKIELNCFSLV